MAEGIPEGDLAEVGGSIKVAQGGKLSSLVRGPDEGEELPAELVSGAGEGGEAPADLVGVVEEQVGNVLEDGASNAGGQRARDKAPLIDDGLLRVPGITMEGGQRGLT